MNDNNNKGQNILIKNCLQLDSNQKKCKNCKEGYTIYNNNCYSKECTAYGECQLCSEYDCIQCLKGFKIEKGICVESDLEIRKRNIWYVALIPAFLLTIFIILIVFYFFKKLKALIKYIKNNQKIKRNSKEKAFGSESKMNLEVSVRTSNQGILSNGNSNSNNLDNNSNNNINNNIPIVNVISNNSRYENESDVESLWKCSLCNSEAFGISNCGCYLCNYHYNVISKNQQKVFCIQHKKILMIGFVLPTKQEKEKTKKEKMRKDYMEQLCPVCNIREGDCSFDCKCQKKFCFQCYQDIMIINGHCPICPLCKESQVKPKKGRRK